MEDDDSSATEAALKMEADTSPATGAAALTSTALTVAGGSGASRVHKIAAREACDNLAWSGLRLGAKAELPGWKRKSILGSS